MLLHNRSRYALVVLIAGAAAGAAGTATAAQEVIIPAEQSVEIDDAAWATAQKSSSVQRWLEAQMLVEGGASAPRRAPDGPYTAKDDLRTFSQTDAIGWVNACDSIDELRQLGGLEARPTVKAAIRKRLTALGA